MKKVISFVMCIVMIASVFSVLSVSSLAAADASSFMSAKQSVVQDGKITYTISLIKGVKFKAVINHIKYDASVLAPVESSVKILGDYGDEEKTLATYGKAEAVGDGVYSIATVLIGDTLWNSTNNGTALMQITFKIIDSNATKFDVNFDCVEFNSTTHNIPNNLDNPSRFATLTSSALAPVKVAKAETYADGNRITWYATPNAASYRVYKKTSSGWVAIDNVPGDTTTYIDKTVAHNENRSYTVRAFDADGFPDSGKGNAVSARFIMGPKTVKATLSANSMKVSWSAVSGATGYRVYRRVLNADGSVGDLVLVKKATAAEKSFVDKQDLVSNTRYQYVVRTVTKNGTSAAYSAVKVWYHAAPAVSLASVKGGLQVKWNKIPGATKYRIYRRYKTTDSWTKLKDVPATQTSYIDTSVPAVKTAYYTVKAYTENGASGYVQKGINYVKTPILKSVTNTASNITLKWEAVKGATSYVVYRKAGSATSWTNVATVKTNSYADKNVKAGTTYRYTVRACYSKYTSGYDKNGIAARRLTQPTLSKAVNNAAGINVTWSKVAGASGYNVYRKTGSSGWVLLGTFKPNSYTDKAVKNGTTYTYTVRAVYGTSLSTYNKTGISVKCK